MPEKPLDEDYYINQWYIGEEDEDADIDAEDDEKYDVYAIDWSAD